MGVILEFCILYLVGEVFIELAFNFSFWRERIEIMEY